ncbi:MAG: hypothetical protein ACD_26C00167G0004 [uncultured bacterium]|nr:MAG: hypothetical protein ACD_26C00167G0004 [uncultured bacterium]
MKQKQLLSVTNIFLITLKFILSVLSYLGNLNFYDIIFMYMRNKNNPLVSIVIPAHNEEKWINICIQSFLNQTYKNIEIIVINDASIDKTLEILKKYLRIKVISFNKNQGEAMARTTGVKHSNGNIILQTDADAEYPKDFIQIAVNEFSKNKKISGISLGEIKVHKNQKGIIADYWRIKRKASFLSKQNCKKLATGCVFIKNVVYDKIGYYDSKMIAGTDVDFSQRMINDHLDIKWLPQLFIRHADPAGLNIFIKRIYNGAKFTRFYLEKYELWLNRWGKITFILRNMLLSFLPIYLLLGLINKWWFLILIIIFSLESFGPLFFLFEQRTMWIQAIKQKKILLFFLIPFILFLQIRASAYGKLYALFFPDKVKKSVTFDIN